MVAIPLKTICFPPMSIPSSTASTHKRDNLHSVSYGISLVMININVLYAF